MVNLVSLALMCSSIAVSMAGAATAPVARGRGCFHGAFWHLPYLPPPAGYTAVTMLVFPAEISDTGAGRRSVRIGAVVWICLLVPD